jgi:hypothetical protein
MKNRPFMALIAIILVIGQFFSSTGGLVLANNSTQGTGFGITPLKEWKEIPYKPQGDGLPVKLEKVENPGVMGGFTQEQKAFLSKNGFVVLHTGDEQFSDIRARVSNNGQPYYLTTDAAYHALHINFDALLKQLEKEILITEAYDIVKSALTQVSGYSANAVSTNLETDVHLAEGYLAVALRLFDNTAKLPPELEKRIQPQLDQIKNEEGRQLSALIPNFVDDYGAYKPVGHYAGDADLENYFRGMTWLGRVAFMFKDTGNPNFKPSHAPLIITLALREAKIGSKPVFEKYTRLMDTLGYLVGPTDDGGPFEVGALMDTVYGKNLSMEALANDLTWQSFLSRVDELPQPQINSTFANTTKVLNAERSWRLMGQRFTLDGLIFQNMIYDLVGSNDNKREFPSGLDVAAVLGSTAAVQAQKAAGETNYQNYQTQLEKMKTLAQDQPQEQWLGTFYSGWLYSFFPQLQPKGEAYPPLMGTTTWQNREMNSMLGSWAELKHDTILYTKMPEMKGGGGPPGSPPAPAYVEPNPNVFYRLAYITRAIKDGLESRKYLYSTRETFGNQNHLSYTDLLTGLDSLAEEYLKLGDIAIKELQGFNLTDEDIFTIKNSLGIVESKALLARVDDPEAKEDPIPVVAAVSGANDQVLEAAVGKLDRLYVVVSINGKLQIAQGGVFTYYEFKQPRSNRLTDQQWRSMVEGTPPQAPAYTQTYTLPGGKAKDVMVFRKGDVYIITEEGGTPPLSLRSSPSKSSEIIKTLEKDTYVEILDGPVKVDGYSWWKVMAYYEQLEGWVAENPAWYERQ